MTYEELCNKYKDKPRNKETWKAYLDDFWGMPLSEIYKVPTITGCEKGMCVNCDRKGCEYLHET